jgi:hypothetical protein
MPTGATHGFGGLRNVTESDWSANNEAPVRVADSQIGNRQARERRSIITGARL